MGLLLFDVGFPNSKLLISSNEHLIKSHCAQCNFVVNYGITEHLEFILLKSYV